MEEKEELTEEEWDRLVRELFRTWHGLRPSGHDRPDMELMGQKQIMHVLAQNEDPVTPGALADACHVTSARIARALKQLEAQGLIVRTEDPEDGRRTLVSLTEKGQDFVAERKKRIGETMKEFCKELGAEDTQELLRIMRRVAELAPEIQKRFCQKQEEEGTR